MSQQSVRDGIATAETVTTYATATVPTDSFVLPDDPRPGPEGRRRDGDLRVRRAAGRAAALGPRRLAASTARPSRTETGFPDGDRLDLVTTGGEPSARVITDVRGADAGADGGTERHVLDVYVPVHAGRRASTPTRRARAPT